MSRHGLSEKRSVASAIAQPMALIGAVLLVASCSNTSAEPDDIDLPQKDRAHWVLPLDKYLAPRENPVPDEAWLVEMHDCMAEAGYVGPEIPVGYAPPKDPVVNNVGFRLFDETIAKKYGYHRGDDLPSDAPEHPGDVMARKVKEWGPGASSKFDACSKKHDHILNMRDVTTAEKLSLDADINVKRGGGLHEVEEKWHECMKPLGIPSLPESPREFPTDEVRAKLGLDSGDDSAGSGTLPSKEEIDLAVHDATCRESSGYSAKSYDMQWNAEVDLLRANKAALEQELANNQERIAETRGILEKKSGR